MENKEEINDKRLRLFIKNLVFDINEKMLRKLFNPYG
jgi:hypothetical protein